MPSWLTFPLHDQAKACPLSCVSRSWVGTMKQHSRLRSRKKQVSIS